MYKERVQTRQLRTRPKTAIKSRDKQTTNPFCPPEEGGPATIVLTIVGTPSRDFSVGTEDEESSSLFLRHHYHHCCCCRYSSSSRALSQLSSSSRVVFCRDSPCLWSQRERIYVAPTTWSFVLVWSRQSTESSGSTGFSKRVRARESQSHANRTEILSSFHRAPRPYTPTQCCRQQSVEPLFATSR